MNGPPDPSPPDHHHPVGDERSQIQTSLLNNLKKVPGIENTRYGESEQGVEYVIVAEINTDIYADGTIDADAAKILVNWWPVHDDENRHWFQFHYSDTSGFDCGFHRQENSHVDGLNHYQERDHPDSEYEYHELRLRHENPVGVLWEIIGTRLQRRLKQL